MAKTTIVVCDDEELIRWSLCEHLTQEGFTTIPAANGEECLQAVGEHAPSLVLMDLKMPVMDGLSALRTLRERGHDVPVIVITAHGGVESAIKATRLGATGYLSKPFDLRETTLAVRKALEEDRLRTEVHYLRNRERIGYGDYIGQSKVLAPLFETLERLEKVDAPTVLLMGESGTGKDVIARTIHSRGPRKSGPFMEIDCAALPEQLIESELFGHERGAFTDARTTKRGLFEVAHGGVVFLDEIGELSHGTQAKLLRALENRTFKRVGGIANITMNAAVITATNRHLKEDVETGRFREDLYFRLNVIPIFCPPLRDRRDDVPLLVSHFLDHFAKAFGRRVKGVTAEALEFLKGYGWPGNVRELRNVLERIVILSPEEVIRASDLPPEVRFAAPNQPSNIGGGCPFVLPESGIDLEEVERGLIAQALERTTGNQSAAARLLGITRYALRYRMEKYHLLEKEPAGSGEGV
ncbi:MAG: sigma-54-dependent Fis family transcriptional regulator [Deltaproteobacteria bacterium]|nr:sigma-54-dependent Fis family transcriptional regulator [Deltaproteobacteria bacterium]MBW2253575.1 sigma-54-dependent Fis family transcriptional regulator [Deltaproteobacteria bacterium]